MILRSFIDRLEKLLDLRHRFKLEFSQTKWIVLALLLVLVGSIGLYRSQKIPSVKIQKTSVWQTKAQSQDFQPIRHLALLHASVSVWRWKPTQQIVLLWLSPQMQSQAIDQFYQQPLQPTIFNMALMAAQKQGLLTSRQAKIDNITPQMAQAKTFTYFSSAITPYKIEITRQNPTQKQTYWAALCKLKQHQNNFGLVFTYSRSCKKFLDPLQNLDTLVTPTVR